MKISNTVLKRTKFWQGTGNVIYLFFLFSAFISYFPGLQQTAEAQDVIYVTSYAYDDNGNVTDRTTPNGHLIQHTYDSLNRLIKKTYPDLSEVSYDYDADGNLISMIDPHGTTYYGYDRYNKIRAVQFPGLSPIYYDYDKAGNLTSMTYPTGEEVTYAYDNDGRLVGVTDNTGTTTYEYDNLTNNLVRTTLPNGVITEYTYDLARRITDVVNTKADETLISSYHYTFDANNNRTQVIETTSSGIVTIDYTYDKLNRLTSANYSDGTYEMYTYDSSGNRLTKTTQNGTINYEYDGDNRLQRAGNTIFFYDNSGNLIRKMSATETINYNYDYENRLIQYSDGTNLVSFEYDGDGNRISKTVNGVETKYVNDLLSPITQVLFELNIQNYVISRYTYGNSRINQINQGATSFYLYDNPDRSVTVLVDNAQSAVNSYQYDSFGNIKAENETVGNSFKYVGEQYDDETGLIYLRNRYYDPEIGRFISKDPFPGHVTEPQTKNPYPYVGNNPGNAVDPLGMWQVNNGPIDNRVNYGQVNSMSNTWSNMGTYGGNYLASRAYQESSRPWSSQTYKTMGIALGVSAAAPFVASASVSTYGWVIANPYTVNTWGNRIADFFYNYQVPGPPSTGAGYLGTGLSFLEQWCNK